MSEQQHPERQPLSEQQRIFIKNTLGDLVNFARLNPHYIGTVANGMLQAPGVDVGASQVTLRDLQENIYARTNIGVLANQFEVPRKRGERIAHRNDRRSAIIGASQLIIDTAVSIGVVSVGVYELVRSGELKEENITGEGREKMQHILDVVRDTFRLPRNADDLKGTLPERVDKLPHLIIWEDWLSALQEDMPYVLTAAERFVHSMVWLPEHEANKPEEIIDSERDDMAAIEPFVPDSESPLAEQALEVYVGLQYRKNWELLLSSVDLILIGMYICIKGFEGPSEDWGLGIPSKPTPDEGQGGDAVRTEEELETAGRRR